MWVDQKTGQRQDVAHRLLFPVLDGDKSNLQVITQTKVVRVLFDADNKATGVEYLPFGSDKNTAPSVIRVKKLAVVAGGAFGSPQILQRSGVGRKDDLSKLGINVVSDLPGVGTNYQDHQVIFYPYISTADASETLDGIASGRLTVEAALQQKAASPERYVLGWNGFDCVGKIRPSPADEADLGSELRELWQRDFELRPERPLMLMSSVAAYVGDHSLITTSQHFSLGPYTPYPYSRGSIHITGPSISDTPDFDGGFLDHPVDLQKLVWGYKKQRNIARRMGHYRGALQIGHPMFADNSKAGFVFVDDRDRKMGRHMPIEYSEEDDDAIETFIRQNVGTAWHSLGTCAMKPREKGGVVDGQLNVHGILGLKVIGKFTWSKMLAAI
jgi:alcohol oxidase